jgi:hypothetical protein
VTGISQSGVGISEKVFMTYSTPEQPPGSYNGLADVFVLREILQNSKNRRVPSTMNAWSFFECMYVLYVVSSFPSSLYTGCCMNRDQSISCFLGLRRSNICRLCLEPGPSGSASATTRRSASTSWTTARRSPSHTPTSLPLH